MNAWKLILLYVNLFHISVLGYFLQFLPIGIEDAGFGDETDVDAVRRDDRQIPGVRLLKFPHYALHSLVSVDVGGRGLHIIVDVGRIVDIRSEHIATDVREGDEALEPLLRVQHGEHVALRRRHGIDEFAERRVNPHGREIRLHQVRRLEERQNSLIAVVCKELS